MRRAATSSLRTTRSHLIRTASPAPLLLGAGRPRWEESSAGVLLRGGGGLGSVGGGVGATRGLFGIGEVLGVITNPGEVLRSLAESKRLLEEARQEMKDNSERAQIPTSHTFSPLPGFFERPRELQALERALGSVPAFTVLFGASSAGKTALCRQVLSSPRHHVLHFDLRIAGFADLQSLYFSLANQLEGYFLALPDLCGKEWGWGAFEKESWAFKHDRLSVEKRIEGGGVVKTSDIAHLMELLQSALLKYWQFQPMTEAARLRQEQALKAGEADPSPNEADPTEAKMRRGAVPAPSKEKEIDLMAARTVKEESNDGKEGQKAKIKDGDGKEAEEVEEEPTPPPKRIPVFFLDEAHKLPALIQTPDAMKCLLDSMLVLTKQDRLMHVIHATSDPFYMHWLRQYNIMQHCQILSIGDCSKYEARTFFEDILVPHIPEKLRTNISFDKLYPVFGGKLAHLSDYTSEYINSDGEIMPQNSSHFLQAHSLIHLQLIHSQPPPDTSSSSSDLSSSSPESAPGFQIYSPLRPSTSSTPQGAFPSTSGSETQTSDFTASHLLHVMSLLHAPSAPSESSVAYFPLCRELGASAVDGMVRGRVLELRWSETVTPEGEDGGQVERKDVGPVLVPTTPVVRYAMKRVLEEYREEGRLKELEGDVKGGVKAEGKN